jgi:hypothetical protein
MSESDDLGAFIREIMARFDKKTAAYEAKTAALDAAGARRHAEVMAQLAEVREQNQQIYAEDRAQRAALFKILDRLDGRGGPGFDPA